MKESTKGKGSGETASSRKCGESAEENFRATSTGELFTEPTSHPTVLCESPPSNQVERGALRQIGRGGRAVGWELLVNGGTLLPSLKDWRQAGWLTGYEVIQSGLRCHRGSNLV